MDTFNLLTQELTSTVITFQGETAKWSFNWWQYLAWDFIWSNLISCSPVPHIDHHIMLGSNRNNVLQVWRKGLQKHNPFLINWKKLLVITAFKMADMCDLYNNNQNKLQKYHHVFFLLSYLRKNCQQKKANSFQSVDHSRNWN